MAKPYYKCNAVSTETVDTIETPFSFYVYIIIIVGITALLNFNITQRSDVPHKTLVLFVLAFMLFMTLILWMVGNIRGEGFKGKRKSKTTTTIPGKPQNKTNLSPTLLGVLPVLAMALFATIGHVVYKLS